ncbi:MAG: hypothetical protein WBO74_01450, partial [Thermoanaerobaculia bacterium]
PILCIPPPQRLSRLLNRAIRERLAVFLSEDLAIYAEVMGSERVFPLHAAILRSPSQSVRNLTTWFQLGVIRDADPQDQQWSRGLSVWGATKACLGLGFFFLPNCHDGLSVLNAPIATA